MAQNAMKYQNAFLQIEEKQAETFMKKVKFN